MDEKELFNRDVMYWREVNAISADLIAEVELKQMQELDGQHVSKIDCALLPFESGEVVYELENGGAFKKNEVIDWLYLPLEDLAFYKDQSNSEAKRKEKVRKLSHSDIKSITLKDTKGKVILTKAKI